ncbi:MAG TPA: ergothioneine biosynthesis protein EgtB, partial [Acidimicrobiales bacterium]|nr:ergothioneine biosynthesis protein EgtB [Acidimicrobiales bacterium]
ILLPHLPSYREYREGFGFLFNSYYEAVGSRYPRNARGLISRPGVAEIASYRRHVDCAMTELLSSTPDPTVLGLTELGLHHEQQHQELLLMDIKHVLSQNPLNPAYHRARPAGDFPSRSLGWVEHEGGTVEIGFEGTSFAFDNEQPRHCATVTPFAIADRPVSCGDFLEFIEDGGYERPELWLSDGWGAVNATHSRAPMYWSSDGDSWSVFTLGGEQAIEPAAPVCHLTYYEADAFAHWAGARLPTEVEWEASQLGSSPSRTFDPNDVQPSPINEVGCVGQVWEWTASAYLPYPGFRPAAGAVGEYNGKFMVNQHVLRGGSVATPPGHLRPTYRNFFPPGASWPFTGARLARDLDAERHA